MSGGHDIAAEHIHRRFEHSRLNLIELIPRITALRVYDNSADADPATGKIPKPKLVLHMVHGQIRNPRDLKNTPDWARPIVAAALKLHQRRRSRSSRLRQLHAHACHHEVVHEPALYQFKLPPSEASRGTTLSWARMSGSRRFSDSSKILSLSRKMSRLAVSRLMLRFCISSREVQKNSECPLFQLTLGELESECLTTR